MGLGKNDTTSCCFRADQSHSFVPGAYCSHGKCSAPVPVQGSFHFCDDPPCHSHKSSLWQTLPLKWQLGLLELRHQSPCCQYCSPKARPQPLEAASWHSLFQCSHREQEATFLTLINPAQLSPHRTRTCTQMQVCCDWGKPEYVEVECIESFFRSDRFLSSAHQHFKHSCSYDIKVKYFCSWRTDINHKNPQFVSPLTTTAERNKI